MMKFSEQQKREWVERALWEGVEQGADNQVIKESGWIQQINPMAPVAFVNGIYKCDLGEDTIVDRIRKTISQYTALKIPFRWKVSPSSRPLNLSTLLKEHGLPLKETLFGLYANPASLQIPVNEEISIRELDLETLEDWLTVQATAWKVPPPGIARIREVTQKSLLSGTENSINYVAYVDGVPVASAGVKFHSDFAFLIGAAVNPDRRRQGIYRTLLAHRLKVIESKGLPAVIHCLENTSAPICMKLGFEKICEIQSFEFHPLSVL